MKFAPRTKAELKDWKKQEKAKMEAIAQAFTVYTEQNIKVSSADEKK